MSESEQDENPVSGRRGSAEGGTRDVVEVKCPTCGAEAKVDRAKAEREYKAVCPKGHEIPLAKMI